MNLLRAALYRPKRNALSLPILPSTELSREFEIAPEHCQRYQQLVAWKPGIASLIHPCYLQVLTLPMQLSMMVREPFPFKALGLVHVANEIDVYRLPEQNAKLVLKTKFTSLEKHKRGWVFGLRSEAYVDGQLMQSATSFYLARERHQEEQASRTTESSILPSINMSQLQNELGVRNESLCCTYEFESNSGREYARASGDYNPIHLTKVSAKLLGFRAAIAHGMYTKALGLSIALSNKNVGLGSINSVQLDHLFANDIDSKVTIETQFLQALYLPNSAQFSAVNHNNRLVQVLSSQHRSKTREYLKTAITLC
ncbi:hypothetical protein ISG33_15105 [Glaciecola sp. MH2013]|uniref:MaoC/PaaZ C-terminal domain-containing protein n=1 Tax=Glaciecola sp. MH2013 TaxID=2785524 RepID=UPI00189E2FD9|nr:MaoC/PaaZ C-terminal domain-containing protein [Glaciecola sp. MH2013]MBF7074734.1 hypothetical protein [Glaciecola sp. MH2013]